VRARTAGKMERMQPNPRGVADVKARTVVSRHVRCRCERACGHARVVLACL